MALYVLDSSVAGAWCFPDEETPYTQAALRALRRSGAIVPPIWAYEIRNTVLMGVRRKRISAAHASDFLGTLDLLPIQLREPVSYNSIYALASLHTLTVYDAAYTRPRNP